VRTYVRQIYRRMGVHSRVGLVHASRAKWGPEHRHEAVNLADLEAGPEDMIRMLAAELMTAFADDWYLMPVRLPLGHLARVASLVVDDTFSYKRTPPVPTQGGQATAGVHRA